MEEGSEALEQFVRFNSSYHMTSLCVAETFSVLKAKYFFQNVISEEEYIKVVRDFALRLSGMTGISVEDVPFHDYFRFEEAQKMVQTYHLDFSDALQLATLAKGPFANFGGESEPLLITADSGLAEAGRSEGFYVWNCIQEERPPKWDGA